MLSHKVIIAIVIVIILIAVYIWYKRQHEVTVLNVNLKSTSGKKTGSINDKQATSSAS